MKTAAAALLLLAACACASANLDVIQVGPWFEPRNWREVEVFTSREQAVRPWGGIAIIHSPKVEASGSEGALERMKALARRQAARIGADALIVTVDSADSGPEMGVYEEPQLFISALAIKYVAESPAQTAK